MSEPPPGSSDSPRRGDASGDDGESPLDEHDLDPLQEAILRQSTRRKIVGLLGSTPGLNKQQTADRLGVHRRTLDSHLHLLAWADLVIVRPSDRSQEKLCFLAQHERLWEDEPTRILYGQAPTRHVALVLHEEEPVQTREIAAMLDRAEETVRQHLAKLRDRGLAEKVRSADTVFHVATDELRAWCQTWGDAYRRPWERR